VQVDSPEGLRFWIDDEPAPANASAIVSTLAAGRHTVSLRVDTKARTAHEIKVEVTKPSGSPAEFTVVGGH
jgi:hypothetical protein